MEVGHRVAAGTVLTSPLDAEARSAALDGQTQTAQFYSGVAFGVAASAFIAAVAEFVNKGRRERDAASKPTGQAKRRRRWWPSRIPLVSLKQRRGSTRMLATAAPTVVRHPGSRPHPSPSGSRP